MKVLWLRPSKGDHISVRRERIAAHLRSTGYAVDIVDASGLDAIGALWRGLTGDYDVIAGNVRVGLYLGYPLSRLRRTPLLGDVSDPITDIDYLPGPLFRFFERYEWFVLRRASASVFVYESDYAEAQRRGVPNPTHLPNAVDYGAFADPDDGIVEQARSLLATEGLDPEAPQAIYIGGLAPHYEIEAILDAADRTPAWEFVFVGEGPLEELVEQRAGDADNVHYLGTVEHQLIPGLLSLADVGFCFKDAEQPLKIKEYGAAGLPIIVQPGELEQHYDAEELVFVEPEGPAIGEVLDELAEDTAFYRARAEAARELAKGWEWTDVAEAYDTLFQELDG